jgi:hypothetical protein
MFKMETEYTGANIFDTDYFAKFRPMTGEEIAEEENTTRQNISRVLKDAMGKVYYKTRHLNEKLTPFETATFILEMFGVNQRGKSEIAKFFKLFPPDIRAEIENDGKRIMDKYRRHRK